MLVGLYGTSFHAGLLTIQSVFGHASMIPTVSHRVPTPMEDTPTHYHHQQQHYTLENYLPAFSSSFKTQAAAVTSSPNFDTVVYDLIDSHVVDVLFPCLIVAHILGIIVNLLLVYGVWKHIRWMMIPWLALQGLLALILAGLSLYYLTLFPNKTDCSGPSNHHHLSELGSRESSSSAPSDSSSCYILLWYCVVMLLSLFTLLYYVYIVCDFFSQMKFFFDPADLNPLAEISGAAADGDHQQVEKQQPSPPSATAAPPRGSSKSPTTYSYNLELLNPPVKTTNSGGSGKVRNQGVHVVQVVHRQEEAEDDRDVTLQVTSPASAPPAADSSTSGTAQNTSTNTTSGGGGGTTLSSSDINSSNPQQLPEHEEVATPSGEQSGSSPGTMQAPAKPPAQQSTQPRKNVSFVDQVKKSDEV